MPASGKQQQADAPSRGDRFQAVKPGMKPRGSGQVGISAVPKRGTVRGRAGPGGEAPEKQEETETPVHEEAAPPSLGAENTPQGSRDASAVVESMREHLAGIESVYEKLHQLVSTVWTYLPQHVKEELTMLIDNVVTLLTVDTEGPSQRFADAASQTQRPKPDLGGSSLGRKAAGETESQGPAGSGGRVSEDKKAAATGVPKGDETPALMRKKSSVLSSQSHKQANALYCSTSFQDLTLVGAGMVSGGRSQDSIALTRKVALPPELRGCEAELTLDSDTAYPQLVLSKDRKSVRLGDTLQDLPDNPGRFSSSFAVLGSEGFTSGRHYWEVEVGAGGGWGIGVSKGYVKRKSRSSFNAKKGIWALTSSHPPPSFCETPKLIGVFLDYAGGKVTFFDAENMIPLLTHSAKFTGKIFPFFRLWTKSSYLKLSPCRR